MHSAVNPVTDREIELWKCKAYEPADRYGKENPQQWANIGSNNEENLVKPTGLTRNPPPQTDGKQRRLRALKENGGAHRGGGGK